MISDPLDLSGYSELTLEFSYYPNSMENGEDFFFEISTDNGSSYVLYKSWASGSDFNNDVRYDEVVMVDDLVFSSQTKLRLRCDASGNGDRIFIDDVIVTGCNFANGQNEIIVDQFGKIESESKLYLSNEIMKEDNVEHDLENKNSEQHFVVYPNPTRNFIYLKGHWDDASNEVEILDIYGQRLLRRTVAKGIQEAITLDVEHLNPGIYLLNFIQDQEIIQSEKVIIIAH
jgi:hypothetical protein